ncbi:alpha-1,6-mannosyltransferase subunit (Ecm39), putative [Talaromyces stipitatus ATCC 10500]|uniref:Mannosyltransferase n=1 Tax=Talaromyces stipitatus (strain ATCC 10500 / CBS 375.48 / QM 6759 / NRRL 1006) TaxID=441959 RepID=B8LXP1_TALSN|nr:alpha-1,6-mannosyltransferase subunit (Ecm39), putative [Talaromyces stipitatus ATCC 10500]EED24542.1 alpha-1,6-mannosyltransferase subunit (Ecm39), putative [Talaromyces stipitatus ATCC 10500]
MPRSADLILYSSIPTIILIHLFASPYTKVEESFHIQATHDILTYGIPSPFHLNQTSIAEKFRSEYDHFSFPGAVPRTFIGALGLASASWPVVWFFENVDRQVLVRAILGLFNALSLIVYARGIQVSFGNMTAYWYLVFQASQFHLAYYASRTLSNMFAFGITTIALRLLLPEPDTSGAKSTKSSESSKSTKPTKVTKPTTSPSYTRYRLALILFTIAGIIFRSELALLLATNTIYFFLTRRIRIWQDILPAGIIGLLIGLTATVTTDSYFWQEFPLWPEFSAFKFNVVSGQSSAWGVDPWYFYFASAIPRLLLNPLTWLVCIPVSLIAGTTRRASLSLLVPSLSFVAVYSFQPHKEWRFIIYIIPALTAAAAQGAADIWAKRGKSIIYRLLSLSLVLSTLGSFLFSTFVLLPISSANYPGAQAIQRVHSHGQGTQPRIALYMGNLACQTGVTRFLQHSQNLTSANTNEEDVLDTEWVYDKTEDPVLKYTPEFWDNIDYALMEDHEFEELKASSLDPESWKIIDTITGFGGFRLIKTNQKLADIRQNDDSSSIEINAIRRIAGDGGVDYYKKLRDEIAQRLTRGYWVEMSLIPKIRVVKYTRAL